VPSIASRGRRGTRLERGGAAVASGDRRVCRSVAIEASEKGQGVTP
jgi:hypothetical protein